MTAEGIFHDAHEVYAVKGDARAWIATFSSKKLADQYVTPLMETALSAGFAYEVVPV